MKRFLRPFRKNKSIIINDEKHYDTFYFKSSSELLNLNELLKHAMPVAYRKSQWYADISQVTTVLQIPQARTIFRESLVSSSKNYSKDSIIAVSPAFIDRSQPEHLIGVYEEYCISFKDVLRCFQEQPYILKGDSTIFLSVRLTQMKDLRIRSIYLYELFCQVEQARKTFFPKAENIYLVMYSKDAMQTGLHSVQSADDEGPFVQVKLSRAELHNYIKVLSEIDDLVIDTVTFANDMRLLGGRSNELNITGLYPFYTTISNHRSVDPKYLENALLHADGDRNTVDRKKLKKAVSHIMSVINLMGFGHDIPVKLIPHGKQPFHIFKEGYSPSGESRFVKFRRNVKEVKDDGYKVKKYSVYLWVFLAVTIAGALCYGFLRRRHHTTTNPVTVEDVTQTITAVITLIAGAATFLLIDLANRGEELFDVLRNRRKIDTQKEFDKRDVQQTSDIIEVLRTNRKCPEFLGGGFNTSYIPSNRTSAGLQAKSPISFSVLESIGYGLFECKEGWLYMIDPWNNVFKVSIIIYGNDIGISIPQFQDRPENNEYLPPRLPAVQKWATDPIPDLGDLSQSSPSDSRSKSFPNLQNDCIVTIDQILHHPYHEQDQERQVVDRPVPQGNRMSRKDRRKALQEMTLFCLPMDVDGSVDRYKLESENEDDPNYKCVAIKEKSSGNKVFLSRLLPFRKRHRPVGVMGRYSRFEVTWKRIDNEVILRMDVGIYE